VEGGGGGQKFSQYSLNCPTNKKMFFGYFKKFVSTGEGNFRNFS
jgi:hypothetical protein